MYVRAPVVDKRAVFHLVKFKMFSDNPDADRFYYGVLGTNKKINVDEVYDVHHLNSDRSPYIHDHSWIMDIVGEYFGYMTIHGNDLLVLWILYHSWI